MANAREDAYIKALHDVATHLLGEDWYIVDPVSGAQAAERIATEIKNEYPKRDMSRLVCSKKVRQEPRRSAAILYAVRTRKRMVWRC